MTVNLTGAGMNTNPSKPDFAFPERVASESLKDIRSELASPDADSKKVLGSLINYATAEILVTRDNVSTVLSVIDSVRNVQSSPVALSVIDMMECRVYQNLYNDDRWNLDRRELPLQPYPDNISEWSGEQFRLKITSLIQSALSRKEWLEKEKVSEYSSIITADNLTRIYYPTMYDFVASMSADVLASFDYVDEEAGKLKSEILDDLIAFHKNDLAPFINYTLQTPKYEDNPSKLRFWRETSESEYSGQILSRLNVYESESFKEKAEMVEALRRNIRLFPRFWSKNQLVNEVNELTAPSIRLAVPSTAVAPGAECEVKLYIENTTKIKVDIFRIQDIDETYVEYKNIPKAARVFSTTLEIDSVVPFGCKRSVKAEIKEAGRYAVVALPDGVAPDARESYPTFLVSDVTGIVVQGGNLVGSNVIAVNTATGMPMSGVNVSFLLPEWERKKRESTKIDFGLTDTDGLIRDIQSKKAGSSYGTYLFTKGPSRFVLGAVYPGTPQISSDKRYFFEGYTALPVYKPGDEMEFVFVVSSYVNGVTSLEKNTPVEISLKDANYQEVDTMMLTTDDFGRVASSFRLPGQGLTGIFTIEAKVNDNGRDSSGNVSFMVSDYKLPTFEVLASTVRRDFPSAGDVTIEGTVKDFSGFPLASASVRVKLAPVSRYRWWWGTPESDILSDSTSTDNKGAFSLTFNAETLNGHDFFCATIDVTSDSGETQTVKTYFSKGKPYLINLETSGNINASEKLKLTVGVVNEQYDPVNGIALRFRLIDSDNKEVLGGTFNVDSPYVDFTGVKQGAYTLEISPVDSALAEPVMEDVVIYRPSEKTIAVDSHLWVPVTKAVFKNGKAKILYGIGDEEAYVYVFMSSSSGQSKIMQFSSAEGYHTLDVETMSDDAQMTWVTFISVKNGLCFTNIVEIANPEAVEKMNLKIESFRDRVSPGESETWTVSATDSKGNPLKAALMLDIYNLALSKIQALSFNAPFLYQPQKGKEYNVERIAGENQRSWSKRFDRLRTTSLQMPEFADYGLDFGFGGGAYTSGAMLMNASIASAPVYKMAMRSSNTSDGMIEETEEEEVALDVEAAGAMDEGDSENGEIRRLGTDINYRSAEMPLMLFRPMLTIDSTGITRITFTIPDAISSWQMFAVAFSDNLLSGMLTNTFVTSKPVMVRPNLPRFLREGDLADVRATVMNDTESPLEAVVETEIFNPVDNEVIYSQRRSLTLDAKSSAVVIDSLRGYSDMTMVGYRVRVSSGGFTDGEQHVIPVLPLEETVFESTPFYIPSGTSEYSVKLKKTGEDAKLNLQYCDNPEWYVVSALPGLRKNIGEDANSAAAALFSAAVSEDIIRRNPGVAEAIRTWLANPSDSMLVSMLEKNEELKTMMLNSTPWVRDAASDTERMSRLALLFDKKEVSAVYEKASGVLEQLYSPSGGWKWFGGADDPSLWVTTNVLGMMGHLRGLGCMPEIKTLSRQINESVRWLDEKMSERYAESPSPSGYVEYVRIRDMYPDVKQTLSARKITDAVVEHIVGNWRKYELADKPSLAIILHTHGYNAVAAEILESMRQYSRYTPERGMWFPSFDDFKPWWHMTKNIATALALDAFRIVNPGGNESERLAQWLVLQKEAQAWGTSVATVQVVSSLLSTDVIKLSKAGESRLSVDGKELTPSKIEKLTGSFDMPLSPGASMLEMARSGDSPAFGAVYYRFKANPSDIKSQGCDAVKVEKRLLKRVASDKGYDWVEATSLNVGDRVKVVLTVNASRDLQYVILTDNRAAAFEPVDQLPGYIFSESTAFYRENRDASTNMFIDWLPKGTYILSYELNVNNSGEFTSGLATIQSQYAPALSAHSSGTVYKISK